MFFAVLNMSCITLHLISKLKVTVILGLIILPIPHAVKPLRNFFTIVCNIQPCFFGIEHTFACITLHFKHIEYLKNYGLSLSDTVEYNK